MATAEAAPPSVGPRIVDDPTLPQPWKRIVDGSTGVLYFWNPETNVTQYEEPLALPPLPPGPPPSSSVPKLAPIPGAQTMQPNSASGEHGSQVTQTTQQQGQQIMALSQENTQQMQQLAQPHSLQVAQAAKQHGAQAGSAIQQPLQGTAQPFTQQMMQQPSQHMLALPERQMPHSTIQQMPHSMQQMPQELGQQVLVYQGTQVGQPQSYQLSQAQMQYMTYQQNVAPQGQQSSQQQPQHVQQGQQLSHQQEGTMGFLQREGIDFQHGKQFGFSPSQIQQTGLPSVPNFPPGNNASQTLHMAVQPGQVLQFGGSSGSMQPPVSAPQMPQRGMDMVHQQQIPRFQNQMGPGTIHGLQSNTPSVGIKMGYEENASGRAANEYYVNTNKDGPLVASQLPKLAALPIVRNQQEMRMGGRPLPNANAMPPSGLIAASGSGMHGIYVHATGGSPFPNNVMMRPPGIVGSSDAAYLSPTDVYRQKHEVTATGDDVPPPFMTFDATGFPPEILREIHLAGFSSPTPIQAQTWPIVLQNRDIVAIAKTGSGKTLGYLIPAFILLKRCRNNPQNGPTVLVLAPTRELATQIQDEAIKFGRSSRLSCTCLYGGAPKGPQLKELDRGADIVVATPGRLNDILEMKKIDFGQVSLLVLDEADRMLDMGFEPQIRKIVNEIPPRRQTLMYTATWPKEVRKIASDLLVNPVQVNIGSVDELAANKSITQYVEVVPQMDKQRRLEQIIRSQERGSKVIIFCSTKRLCEQLVRSVGRSFGAAAIHGDKSQVERDSVLSQFRTGKSPVLVATDVAARGLDVKDVKVVINYDFPTGVEDYVHRIGRTGRAGATGVSYTFFSEQDARHATDLIKVLEGANQHVPPVVREMALRNESNFGKDRGGINRFDSGRGDGSGGRWDSSGRGGMRDGNFGGRGGMRDGNFGGRGGRGGPRDGGFGGRGGPRDGGFGGRGGTRDGGFGGRGGMRDGGFGGRGGTRDGGFSGRGGMRDGGFGGRGGMRDGGFGWDRNERGPHDRNMDGRGRGRGQGRGRFDSRADIADRSRNRSYRSSPDMVRTWGYRTSRSRSRSRSWSYSRSRSRSWSRSCSPSRSHSRSVSRSRSRSLSRSVERYERRRKTKFDQMTVETPEVEAPSESRMPPVTQGNAFSGLGPVPQLSADTENEAGNLGHVN